MDAIVLSLSIFLHLTYTRSVNLQTGVQTYPVKHSQAKKAQHATKQLVNIQTYIGQSGSARHAKRCRRQPVMGGVKSTNQIIS